jgi:acetolactate synthase-1/2/3 large subunit
LWKICDTGKKGEMVMRVCDVIAKFIYDSGISDVFTVTGGGAMFLDDGLVCNKDLRVVCCHHEQAAAMSAVAYAKYRGLGCAMVTTGCGATNTVTGVLNAWQDNIPCIFIAGQCKTKEIISSVDVDIRQFGIQEADSVTIVKSITKYAEMIMRPEDTLYHLEKALYIARQGRPGPVWIDVPMDVQQARVDDVEMRHFSPDELHSNLKLDILEEEAESINYKLSHAKRPIVLAGHGVRLSGSTKKFKEFIEQNNIPVVTARMGTDVLPTAHDLYIGRIGNKGTRAGNFAIQNADFILCLGCRMSISTTGYAYDLFAREAEIYVVDIDPNEHKKNTVKITKEINADLANIWDKLHKVENSDLGVWVDQCKTWKRKYPVCTEEHYHLQGGISMYAFMQELSMKLKPDSVIVTDAGSAVYVPAQAIITTTEAQRYITSGAQAEMGFALPASVGVCVARDKKETIGITGDGSFQMNIQELQTIAYNKLPVKLFVWNNDGYLSIRETQTRIFEGRYIGTDSTCGVSFPDFEKIAYAYGIKYYKITEVNELGNIIAEVLEQKGPVLCDVNCIRDERVLTAVTSKKMPDGSVISLPIEDMKPFLDREEFYENMIVKPIG